MQRTSTQSLRTSLPSRAVHRNRRPRCSIPSRLAALDRRSITSRCCCSNCSTTRAGQRCPSRSASPGSTTHHLSSAARSRPPVTSGVVASRVASGVGARSPSSTFSTISALAPNAGRTSDRTEDGGGGVVGPVVDHFHEKVGIQPQATGRRGSHLGQSVERSWFMSSVEVTSGSFEDTGRCSPGGSRACQRGAASHGVTTENCGERSTSRIGAAPSANWLSKM